MKITIEKKQALAKLLNYVFDREESSYENTIEEYGIESEQAAAHAYNLARNLWAEFELDLP